MIQILFAESMEGVLENATFMCGLIRDKEDSMIGELKYVDNYMLLQLREERLLRLLIFEVS
jgi:hypothetical protein